SPLSRGGDSPMAVDADTDPNCFAPPSDFEPDRPEKSRLFLRLFLQNERRLYAYILTLLPNRADADDVLQETSLVMWDKFDEHHPPTDFIAWARRVAYYKVLDYYKTTRRLRARLSRLFLERVAETAGEQACVLQLDDRREALAGCIEKLTRRDRELLAHRLAEAATTQTTSHPAGRAVDAAYKARA